MSHFCSAILLLTLHKCVFCYESCGENKNISAVEGENVILQVDLEDVTDISWVFNNAHIASTKPDNTIDIKSRQYKSKLYTEKNGSLGIAKINIDDSGTFIASIFTKEDECRQSYHLTVYSNFSHHDLQIHHNLTEDEICFITCEVKNPDVTITWSSVDTSYKELASTLHLDRTRMNFTWVCTAINKLINASKIIEPRTLCYDGREKGKVMLVVVVCVVVIILGAVCAYYLKTKMRMMICCVTCNSIKRPKSRKITEDLRNENPYCEIQLVGESPKMMDPVNEQMLSNPIYNTIKTRMN